MVSISRNELQIVGQKTIASIFTVSDITAEYISWLNNPKAMAYSNQRFTSHSFQTCLDYINSFPDSTNVFLKISDLATEQMLGTLTIYFSEPHNTADIGMLIGPSHWGLGYGKDAFNAAVDFMLYSKSARKVTAGTLECNKGMISVIKYSGMRQECRRIKQEVVSGKAVDMLYFAKFRESQDWQ